MPKIVISVPKKIINNEFTFLCDKDCPFLSGNWQSRFFCNRYNWLLITGAAFLKDDSLERKYKYQHLAANYKVNSINVAARCKPCMEDGE